MPDIVTCRNCGKETYAGVSNCPNCGESASFTDEGLREDWNDQVELARKSGDWSEIPTHVISICATDIILTTAFCIPNRETDRVIEVITAECVYGMNAFRDFFADVRDIFGGRSAATQKILRDARKTCLAELRREALAVDADAVISVDLDYNEFSGGGKAMLFLVASGTAVKLKDPLSEDSQS